MLGECWGGGVLQECLGSAGREGWGSALGSAAGVPALAAPAAFLHQRPAQPRRSLKIYTHINWQLPIVLMYIQGPPPRGPCASRRGPYTTSRGKPSTC